MLVICRIPEKKYELKKVLFNKKPKIAILSFQVPI